jgi:ribosome-associated protein
MGDSDRSSPLSSSKAKAFFLLRAALSKKAMDPVLVRLIGLTSITDYFLLVSGNSAKQVHAIAEAVLEDAKKNKIDRLSAEGINQGNWALLDYGDVIIHIFRKPIREFYDLEGLWAEAPRESFPAEIQKEIGLAAETEEEEMDEDF